jgi:hypothetical protein
MCVVSAKNYPDTTSGAEDIAQSLPKIGGTEFFT